MWWKLPSQFGLIWFSGFRREDWNMKVYNVNVQQTQKWWPWDIKRMERAKIFNRCSNQIKNKKIPVRTVQKSSCKIVIKMPRPRAHQTSRSGWNSRPISTEIALPWLQSEIQVVLFLFASRWSFLAKSLWNYKADWQSNCNQC